VVCYFLFYFFARHLPVSYRPYALFSKQIRYWICKGMLKQCGRNVNIEHGADIGTGKGIIIGDNSGIGVNCTVKRAIIGKNVMMGPSVVFIGSNHAFSDPEKPLQEQGSVECPPIEVGDNVWIGTNVIVLPGRKIGKSSIVGAGAVVTKDVPEYAIVAGNPAKVIRYRK